MWKVRSMVGIETEVIIELLKKCDLYYSQDDTPENFRRKLRQDSDLMLVAVDQDNHPIGFVMGSYDGWAAMVWHLAVEWKYRHMGIGTALLKELELRLIKRGATILYGLVLPQNEPILNLLDKGGFKKDLTTWVISKPLG